MPKRTTWICLIHNSILRPLIRAAVVYITAFAFVKLREDGGGSVCRYGSD